jgi:hypothetical protein
VSRFAREYEQFFSSPAGISLLTWLQEQRTTEHDRAEANPEHARDYVATAKGYGQVIQHISSVSDAHVTSRYSSGAGSDNQPDV